MKRVGAWGADGRVVYFDSSEELRAACRNIVSWDAGPFPPERIFSDEQAISIYHEHKKDGFSQRELARKYGVSVMTINSICRGKYGGIGDKIQ